MNLGRLTIKDTAVLFSYGKVLMVYLNDATVDDLVMRACDSIDRMGKSKSKLMIPLFIFIKKTARYPLMKPTMQRYRDGH